MCFSPLSANMRNETDSTVLALFVNRKKKKKKEESLYCG